MTEPPANDHDRTDEPAEQRPEPPPAGHWALTKRSHGGGDGVGYGVADRPAGGSGDGIGETVGGIAGTGMGCRPAEGFGDGWGGSADCRLGGTMSHDASAASRHVPGGAVGAALQHAWGNGVLLRSGEVDDQRAGRHHQQGGGAAGWAQAVAAADQTVEFDLEEDSVDRHTSSAKTQVVAGHGEPFQGDDLTAAESVTKRTSLACPDMADISASSAEPLAISEGSAGMRDKPDLGGMTGEEFGLGGEAGDQVGGDGGKAVGGDGWEAEGGDGRKAVGGDGWEAEGGDGWEGDGGDGWEGDGGDGWEAVDDGLGLSEWGDDDVSELMALDRVDFAEGDDDGVDPVGFVPGFAEPFYGAPARRSEVLDRLEWRGRAVLLVVGLAAVRLGGLVWRETNRLLLAILDGVDRAGVWGRVTLAAVREAAVRAGLFVRRRLKPVVAGGAVVALVAVAGALLVVPRLTGAGGPIWADGVASPGGGAAPSGGGAAPPGGARSEAGAPPAETAISDVVGGLRAASFDLVDSAGTVSLRAGALGEDLYRVVVPGGSDVTPRVQRTGGDLRLFLPPGVHGGPATVAIELNAAVRWTVHLDGGAEHKSVDLTAARVDAVELGGGAKTIELALPEPDGLMPVRMAGGVDQFRVRLSGTTPVRVRVRRGAGAVTLGGTTHRGIAPGRAFTGNGWRGKAGVDLTAEAGMGGLTVTDDDL